MFGLIPGKQLRSLDRPQEDKRRAGSQSATLLVQMSLSPADPAESDLYADNPAWADLTPIQQDVGENPMAPIFYETECASHIYTAPPQWPLSHMS